jgi:hypothetical protein
MYLDTKNISRYIHFVDMFYETEGVDPLRHMNFPRESICQAQKIIIRGMYRIFFLMNWNQYKIRCFLFNPEKPLACCALFRLCLVLLSADSSSSRIYRAVVDIDTHSHTRPQKIISQNFRQIITELLSLSISW